jgi:hypothetical protein
MKRRTCKPRKLNTTRWADRAFFYLYAYALANRGPFLAEQVVASSIGAIAEPKDRRAWGAVFAQGYRWGIIKRVGYATDGYKSPKSLWSPMWA